MRLKSDIINGAYSRMRISGLTVQPSAEDNDLALRRLEQMAALFFKKNICVGYKFEETPDAASLSGVPVWAMDGFELCLADRLLADFGKTPPDPIKWEQNVRGAFSTLTSETAPRRQTQYPNRMPRGKFSRVRWGWYNRFYHPEITPDPGCDTTKMLVGDIEDYIESFAAYLNDGEIISSFTTEIDTGLTLVSSSISSTEDEIEYRIQADETDSSGQYRSLSIQITTDAGRVKKRIINFSVTEAGTNA